MSKIIILFLLSISLLTANEIEEFPFLGITVSTQSVDLKDINDQKNTTIGIRYGKQTVDWRTMFTYEYKSGLYKSFSMEIDNILLDELFGMPEYRPYIGASIGTLKYEDDSLTDNSGYFYGAHVGLLMYVTDNIDADLSYHFYQVEDIEGVDNIQGGTLSLHYFY